MFSRRNKVMFIWIFLHNPTQLVGFPTNGPIHQKYADNDISRQLRNNDIQIILILSCKGHDQGSILALANLLNAG